MCIDLNSLRPGKGEGLHIMRVLICDDHPIVASAIGMTLECAFDAQVQVVNTCAAALEEAHVAGPFDLIMLDLHIPGEDPAGNLRAARAACPDTPIVVFSGSEDPAYLRLALELDINGFLPKSSRPEVLEAALRLVMAGGRYLPDAVRALALADTLGPVPPAPESAETAPALQAVLSLGSELTERQHEVLQLLATGAANKQIARALGISPYTVKAHVAQVLLVLGATNRTQAVDFARRQGLI